MTPSCPDNQPRQARRGRLLSTAFMLLGGLALLLNAAPGARAQTPTPTPTPGSLADLTVTKSGDEAVAIGATITYNLVVSNGGPDGAVNVRLSDPIPAHTTFVSADITSGSGTFSFDGTTLDVIFDSIPAFESGSASLVVRVNNDTPRGTTISNTVIGNSDTPDPNREDNSATAFTAVTGPFAGDLLISEFRLRGPAGATDEYIEIYNNADAPRMIQSVDDSQGFAVVASDGVVRCTLANGMILPARGHFLCVNSAGYSLSEYPAGESSTATGDAAFQTDIPDNAGIAIFRTTNPESFNLTNRLDAAGSTAEKSDLYREGAGYTPLSPLGSDYALYRDLCGKAGSVSTFGTCPTGGTPIDTDNNASDFVYVDPNGTNLGVGRRLGAAGPENLSSPVQRNSSFSVNLLDPCVGASAPPNRVRSFTSDPANNSTFGTLDIRRTVTNNTGENVTRLRWRIIDISTYEAPSGVADLRARSSLPLLVTVDGAPCGAETSDVTVQGTTLEEPPVQVNGGGFNSSLSSGTVSLDTPLADGESINVRFLLGIQQTGNFKFFINVEALTREAVIPESKPPSPAVGPTVRPRKGVSALPSSSSSGASAQPAQATKSTPSATSSKSVSASPARTSVKGARKARREVDARDF